MATLLKLHLENYRKLKSIDINFDGQSGQIMGKNRIGKTSVLEAIHYLLTDKLLEGASDITPIKNAEDKRATVVVEGTFMTDMGEITLRKEYKEKWVRARGGSTEEMTGHQTDYFVNGAKQARAKDYFDQITSKFGIPTDFYGLDSYQLAIDPFYLAKTVCGGKDWQKARKAIIGIVGDVTPEEIFQADQSTLIAKEDLERHQYDTEEAKKAIRGEIEGYKKDIALSQAVVDEYSAKEDVDSIALEQAKKDSEEAQNQIVLLKQNSANPYANDIKELQDKLYEKQNELYKEQNAMPDRTALDMASKAMSQTVDEWNKANRLVGDNRASLSKAKATAEGLEAKQAELVNALKELGNEYKGIHVEDTCPTCGQKLPEGMVNEALASKRKELTEKAAEIHEKADENKKRIDSCKAEIMALQDDSIRLQANLDNAKKSMDEASVIFDSERRAFDSARPQIDPSLKPSIDSINAQIAELKRKTNEAMLHSNSQIAELNAKKSKAMETIVKHDEFMNAQKRIKELKEKINALGREQGDAEQRMWAVNEFVKTKLQLLDRHMKEKFGEVRFQLIKENIKEGSYNEVCVPYIVSPATGKGTSTSFPNGSKSEQIYTGCKIIEAIRSAMSWQPLPILFDQGGELDYASAMKVSQEAGAQTISVKVGGEYDKPTFEALR